MQTEVQKLSRLGKVLSSPTRIHTLCKLIEGKRPHEIAKELEITVQAVSVAIRILADEGLLDRIGVYRNSRYVIPAETLELVGKLFDLVESLHNG